MIPGSVPYLPSLQWAATEGAGATLRPRDYTRTLIESNTPGGQLLTVPVEGGASEVKRGDVGNFKISDHGDWIRIHCGALEAAYGREPFFQHIFPGLSSIIEHHGESLMGMNSAILLHLYDTVEYDEEREEMIRFKESHRARWDSIRERLLRQTDPTHSIAEPLFRFGKDTLFLIL